ncbi:MAG: hypothetical protein V5A37_03285 [Halobacteriales archaeon]
MGLLIWLAEVATALNVVLLAALAAVWVRNYRQFRSKHTLGMLTFALLLLSENAIALYFYLWHPMMSEWFRDSLHVPTAAMRGMLILDLIELVAIVFLVWVTVD